MSFLLFLRGLLGVLLVFAATTYYVTQSFWTTLVQTAICALLLQIGYFIAVLFLIWRSSAGQPPEASKGGTQIPSGDVQPGPEISHLPTLPRSRHL
jgi:exopolysaccharide production repressor protein